jgi:sec-independent protein translocase protein TatA
MFRNPVTDVIVVLVIVLLIMGPKRLPQLGKGLGHGMREFKDGITGQSKPDEEQQSINQASATPDPAAPRQAETQAAAGSAPADSQRQA